MPRRGPCCQPSWVNPEKHAAKRRQILDAAAEVFGRCGYDGATTAVICRTAGIGSGTLFHYFPDKRSLMVAMFDDDIATNKAFFGALDRANPVAALWQVVDHLTADLASPLAPGIMAAAMQLALRDEEFAALVDGGDQYACVILAGLVKAGQVDGSVDVALDPSRAGRWIQGVINAGYFMTDQDDFDAVADRTELHKILAAHLGVE